MKPAAGNMGSTNREALSMKPAKIRYAFVSGFACARCGAADGAACSDTQTGKARRTPHKERTAKAYSSPAAKRAHAAEIVAPPAPRSRVKAPKAAPPSHAVHGMFAAIAEAFGAR